MRPDLLTAGIRGQDAGAVLAAIMAASTRPATLVLGRLAGCTLSVRVLASGTRPLDDAERHRLAAADIAACRYRTALLITPDGTVAAGTHLAWLPGRLPPAACRALDDGAEPAGAILAPLGMTRADRRALATAGIEEITGAAAAVRSSAVLMVAGAAAAIAEENITREFADLIAGRAW